THGNIRAFPTRRASDLKQKVRSTLWNIKKPEPGSNPHGSMPAAIWGLGIQNTCWSSWVIRSAGWNLCTSRGPTEKVPWRLISVRSEEHTSELQSRFDRV